MQSMKNTQLYKNLAKDRGESYMIMFIFVVLPFVFMVLFTLNIAWMAQVRMTTNRALQEAAVRFATDTRNMDDPDRYAVFVNHLQGNSLLGIAQVQIMGADEELPTNETVIANKNASNRTILYLKVRADSPAVADSGLPFSPTAPVNGRPPYITADIVFAPRSFMRYLNSDKLAVRSSIKILNEHPDYDYNNLASYTPTSAPPPLAPAPSTKNLTRTTINTRDITVGLYGSVEVTGSVIPRIYPYGGDIKTYVITPGMSTPTVINTQDINYNSSYAITYDQFTVPGEYRFYSIYSGNDAFETSRSRTFIVTINKIASRVTLDVGPHSGIKGTTFTLSGVLSPKINPLQNVTIYMKRPGDTTFHAWKTSTVRSATPTTYSHNWRTSGTTPIGVYQFYAKYNGNAIFRESQSPTVNVTVTNMMRR